MKMTEVKKVDPLLELRDIIEGKDMAAILTKNFALLNHIPQKLVQKLTQLKSHFGSSSKVASGIANSICQHVSSEKYEDKLSEDFEVGMCIESMV